MRLKCVYDRRGGYFLYNNAWYTRFSISGLNHGISFYKICSQILFHLCGHPWIVSMYQHTLLVNTGFYSCADQGGTNKDKWTPHDATSTLALGVVKSLFRRMLLRRRNWYWCSSVQNRSQHHQTASRVRFHLLSSVFPRQGHRKIRAALIFFFFRSSSQLVDDSHHPAAEKYLRFRLIWTAVG